MLLTNQSNRSAVKLIGRYAQRMLIENNIDDGIDFFHMDALSSAVAMKVNCDLQLTLMASSLYRLLARASAMATRPPNHDTSSATSSMPLRRSRSPSALSTCDSRGEHTIRCCPRPGSIGRTLSFLGWVESDCV